MLNHELTIEPQPIGDQAKCSCGWRESLSVFDFPGAVHVEARARHAVHLDEFKAAEVVRIAAIFGKGCSNNMIDGSGPETCEECRTDFLGRIVNVMAGKPHGEGIGNADRSRRRWHFSRPGHFPEFAISPGGDGADLPVFISPGVA